MTRKKEYDFVVTLKHPDYKIYNVISMLMCAMAVTTSIFGMLHSNFISIEWINIFLIGFIFFYLLIPYLNKNNEGFILTFKWALFACAFLWLFYPLNAISIAFFYVIAALLERQIKFPQEIGFDKDGITFNTFPFRQYAWQEIANLILKDNLLTIDFKNNKVLQKETESEVTPEIEKEFNQFCFLNLNTSAEHISEHILQGGK